MPNMIPFVDVAPRVETRGDLILLALTSGDEVAPFVLTRHAATALGERLRLEVQRLSAGGSAPVLLPLAAPRAHSGDGRAR